MTCLASPPLSPPLLERGFSPKVYRKDVSYKRDKQKEQADGYSGMFPCFLYGRVSALPRSMAKVWIRRARVSSIGSTSSM